MARWPTRDNVWRMRDNASLQAFGLALDDGLYPL
jgi:hypothetical protein